MDDGLFWLCADLYKQLSDCDSGRKKGSVSILHNTTIIQLHWYTQIRMRYTDESLDKLIIARYKEIVK